MRKIALFLAFICIAGTGFSSNQFEARELTGAQADAVWQGAELVWLKQENTIPAFISFRAGSEPTEEAFFIIARRLFHLPASYNFDLIGQEKDELGWVHKRFQLTVNDIPVDNGIFLLHLVNGKVKKYNGYLYKNVQQPSAPSLNETAALNRALASINATIYKWQLADEENWLREESGDVNASYFPKGELEITQVGGNESNEFKLAWKFDIYAHEPMSRNYVYVDAHTGEILNTISRIHEANTPGTAVTAFRGSRAIVADSYNSQYRLYETTRGLGIRTRNMLKGTSYTNAVEFLDADNVWNNVNANLDQYAGDAHWGAEMTYDFYTTMGRNSIDGNGQLLNLYVHYSSGYVNAFWDGSRMTFGDGNSSYKPLTSLDITAHEISHGLDQKTAGLVYQNESGALNESFSDIFGTAVEWYADSTKGNWTIGEDIGSTFRSMLNPKAYSDPNCYGGTYWYTGTGDNGGVHTNSGVQNHWYYILSQGKSGTNDKGSVYNVTGIGMKKATSIAWRNMVNYLTRNSTYADARFYAIQAAVDLFGACSPEVAATTNAWYAVGVGTAYVQGVHAQFTASPTNGCVAPMTVNFNNTSSNSTSYFWDFGDGTTSTQTNPSKIYSSTGNFTVKLRSNGGSCGVDSLVRTNYISIGSTNPCIVTMPATGTYQTQTACSGTIYDNGGPSANYSDQTSSTVTISPIGATQVRLTFTQFQTENGYDYVYVYDGPSTNSPVIGSYTGSTLPPVITSTGPSITIRQYSDLYVNAAGFTVNWTCILPTTPPTANFTSDVTSSCSGIISFTDLSLGATSWLWTFGDGTTSTVQHPVHQYLTNGIYTVSLKATNNYGSNTATKASYITISKPAAPVANNVNLCGSGTASLSANITGPVTWYDSLGNVVSSSNPFTTPVITATKTYWVEDSIPQPTFKVGPATNTIGSGGYLNNSWFTRFNVMKKCKLVSILAYAQNGGYRTVQYKDPAGGVIAETTVYFPAGGNRIPLDIDLIPGNGYLLGLRDTINLYRNTSGAVYPYTDANGMVRITGNNATNATNYFYYLYDWELQEADCITERKPVTVTVNPVVSASITASTNPACSVSNGTATVSPAGGTPGFTYKWNNNQTGATATGLPSGTATVTVTDTKGCSATASKVLTQSSAVVVNTTATDVTCYGLSNGTINVSVTGGTPVYSYNWGGGVTSQNRTGLAPGTYSVTINDAGGCSGTASQTIGQPTEISASVSKTDASCNLAMGTATVTSSGGTGSHTYTWSNNQTNATITNLPAGPYSVVVKDANNCTVSAATIINNSSSLTFTHSFAPATCYGDSNGTANVQVTSGKAPFSYLWSNDETTSSISNLPAGTYYLTITDADRCDKHDTIIIAEPDKLNLILNLTEPSCKGGTDGNAYIQIGGGTPNYSIQWSSGGSTSVVNQLIAGSYEVTVTDSHQCEVTKTFDLSEPDAISLNPNVINVSCFGNHDGNVILNPTGGTPEYSFLWNTNATSQNLEFVVAGTYTVTITDDHSCTTSATYTVTQPQELQLNISITNATNPNNGSITVTVVNGNPQDYTYLWSTGATTPSINQLAPGVYSLTVTDANGCEKTTSVTVTLTTDVPVISASQFSFSITPNPSNGMITLTVNKLAQGTVMSINNILGQHIMTTSLSHLQTQIDLSSLTAGIYFVEVRQGDTREVEQLVLTR